MTFTDHTVTLLAIGTSTVVILGGIGKGVETMVKLTAAIDRIGENVKDFRGRPADPERGILTPVPGVMEQLAAGDRGRLEILRRLDDQDEILVQVKTQLFPNGGSSVADQVKTIAQVITAAPRGESSR